ncbi:WD40 repeat-like protein [Rhizopogon vinicolor AM-OR11-026]|uniref:WD40 repeat-like protein n=1 Tax=Rhizopogon vinicolor AM-OR11-026 TaxID=1314800 RepID=A0A1B7MIK8_9AGAM|nr:WD40 repeat-like protein [Rhizopogon vinicolor AM-OR11-026]
MSGIVLDDNYVTDLTSQMTELRIPITSGSFAQVYRSAVVTSQGTTEVAVKVFKNDMKGIEKGIRRELKVWLRLRHPTIVPLLGIAYFEHPLPALVSQWMPSRTLYIFLEKQATTLTAPTKVGLAKGIAEGLNYLHSENVVHGDLHPENVLVGDSGNPCLAGFGLATIIWDTESQLTATTAGLNFDSRWRAPEVIGIEHSPERPTFKSDTYSFGSVMFFVISGDIPWKEKKHAHQICVALSKRATPVRPHNISDNHWDLIQRCWSWAPEDRPRYGEVIKCMNQFRIDDSQIYSPITPLDLTGQIFGTTNDYVAGGSFGNVYRCEWRRPTGLVKVAVKVVRFHTSKEELRRFQREAVIWACLVHENIVSLFGTTEGFGPSPALVSPWFPDGTLLRLIAEQGATLSIQSRLNLLHDVASGLYYLHCFPIVHGDISSSNVMVCVRAGQYQAHLTDFGLATVLGGLLDDHAIEKPTVRHGAIRWTAPELLRAYDHPTGIKPTIQNDMYSFGRIMFHVLTLVSPWSDIDDFGVLRRILSGEEISRPEKSDATRDITDARWNKIQQCWSVESCARPSALMAMDFLKSELQAVTDNESRQRVCLDMVDTEKITASDLRYITPTEVKYTVSHAEKTRVTRPRRQFEGHTNWVRGVVHLPGGQRIITCSYDDSLRIWNLGSGEQIGNDWRDGQNEVNAIALSPDGKQVVSGSGDGTVSIWDIDTGKVIVKWTGHTKNIRSVRWNRVGERVLSGAFDGTARVWDVESGETLLAIKTGLNVHSAIYSPDETMIATGGSSEDIKIFDAKTGKLVAILKGHAVEVNCLAWTADGTTLISGSYDCSIRTWNTTTWQQVNVLTGHTYIVYHIEISPNGRILASASWDNTARLWNLENGQPIASPLQHANWVRCVSFSTDGKLLATGCDDNNAYIWDVSAIVREAGLDELLLNPNDGHNLKSSDSSDIIQRIYSAREAPTKRDREKAMSAKKASAGSSQLPQSSVIPQSGGAAQAQPSSELRPTAATSSTTTAVATPAISPVTTPSQEVSPSNTIPLYSSSGTINRGEQLQVNAPAHD